MFLMSRSLFVNIVYLPVRVNFIFNVRWCLFYPEFTLSLTFIQVIIWQQATGDKRKEWSSTSTENSEQGTQPRLLNQ